MGERKIKNREQTLTNFKFCPINITRIQQERKKEEKIVEKETTPSQSEWLVMEIFWSCGTSLTAKEVIKKMKEKADMSPRMVRVLLNRLWQKGVLSYTVDEHDARVYHYSVVKSKEECQKEKSRRFVESYFEGNRANAMAALIGDANLTDEQFRELEGILEQCKDKDKK